MPEFDRRPVRKPNNRRRAYRRKESFVVSVLRGLFPWKGDSAADVVRKIILVCSLGLIVWATATMVDFYVLRDIRSTEEMQPLIDLLENYTGDDFYDMPIPRSGNQGSDNEHETVTVIGQYLQFYELNDDFVGWLEIYPIVQYPVYQSVVYNEAGVRVGCNDFYLNHNHERNPTTNGTIFADWEGAFTPTERPHNTIIYGHNLRTKNLFQPLLNYRPNVTSGVDSFEFLKRNPTIQFDTLYEHGHYKIFAVFQSNVDEPLGEVFDYWNHVYFRSKSHFDNFMAEILDRSMYYTNVDLEYGDEILMLSTCDFSMFTNGDYTSIRLVIAARRVRDNEFAGFTEAEIDAFIDNRGSNADGQLNRRMFEAYYNMRGRQWAGRNWNPNYIKDF